MQTTTLRFLYLGDVMAEPGLKVVESSLPELRRTYEADLVIAQTENLSDGRGVRAADFERLLKAGVDFCTGGNWTLYRDEVIPVLADPKVPIIRPANYPIGTPGLGYKYIETSKGKVLVVGLLGQVVGKHSSVPVNNPLEVIDQILKDEHNVTRAGTIVNFHGDFSSEKRVIGYYLDGRVSAVIGDHWHVPTADAMVLPRGTAHITDVGMCGTLHSSLGITKETIIARWRDGVKNKNDIAENGPYQLNGVLAIIDTKTGLAKSIESIGQIIEKLG